MIVQTPGVIGGEPRIDGTRISAVAIWSFHRAGYSAAEIIKQYPTLTPIQVMEAVSYHQQRRGTWPICLVCEQNRQNTLTCNRCGDVLCWECADTDSNDQHSLGLCAYESTQ